MDTVESSEELKLLGDQLETSLLVRSKPMQSPTLLRKWKRDAWFRALCGRILKPWTPDLFAVSWIYSLGVFPANRLAQPESDLEKKTQDTYFHISATLLTTATPKGCFLKMSKGYYRPKCRTVGLYCSMSLANWKKEVIEQRGVYSARKKSAHLTEEKESLSWPTPDASQRGARKEDLIIEGTTQVLRRDSGQRRGMDLQTAVKNWPTPTMQDNIQVKGNPKHPKRGTTLGGAVRNWPTPAAHEARLGYQRRDTGKKGSQKSLTTIVIDGQADQANINMLGNPLGLQLNPDWVEQLQGLHTGLTDLGNWGTE
jgi:hypothetical protein